MMRERIEEAVFVARTFARAGMVRPENPLRLAKSVDLLRRWGTSIAGGYASAAARRPNATALIDDAGALSYGELDRQANQLARGLSAAGVGAGDGIAVLCRNHRYFVEVTIAADRIGAHLIFLNTMFAAPQVSEVCDQERPSAIVYDDEFSETVAAASDGRLCFVAWAERRGSGPDRTLDQLRAGRSSGPLDPPSSPGRIIILTSGTTGTPKGAQREQPSSLAPAASLIDVIPLRAREITLIAPPLFHSWGMAHFSLALMLGSTIVLQRGFDPQRSLVAAARHGASALVVVPVMLQRMVDLPADALIGVDLSRLKVIAASGSALPGELALRAMDRFGEILYNLYGSTEVAWATVAGPEDLRAAPGTAGRPPRGTVVQLFDDQDRPVSEVGLSGRIFVGNGLGFEGYTGGQTKQQISGLMSAGDVGHFDSEGRLFIDGRDDEMIVSGGENVFPREVEDLLADHPGVAEAAVIGVVDAQWGQRLRAFVVVRGANGPDQAELQELVRDRLARYKVPREVLFIDELPRNATGKVLRRELSSD
jgi:fatty-acyl-CoA synthase